MKYKDFPGALDIEGTSLCNLRCVMCPRGQPGFKEHRKYIGHMSDRIFQRIYRELKNRHGVVGWIWFHVGGEPLLDPRFVERVDLLASTGAYIAASTNVTPLTPELAEAVLRSRLGRLMLSVDGVTKETYESVRVGSKFEKAMANVDMLLEMARGMGGKHPDLWLQCLRMDDTKEEVLAFAEKYGEGKDDKYQSLKGIKKGKVMLKMHETFAAQVEPRGYGWDGASGRGRRWGCRKPFGRATILSGGEVALCCYDVQGRSVVGSLENNSINGVWHSEPFQRVRRGFNEAQLRWKALEDRSDLFPTLCREC